MRDTIEAAATEAGADVVIYDTEAYQNILMDRTAIGRVICLINEFGALNKDFVGNGVITSMPIRVKFVKAVELERTAIENEATLSLLSDCFDEFIVQLVQSYFFRSTVRFSLIKYNENVSDINAIGWTGSATLILNEGYGTC